MPADAGALVVSVDPDDDTVVMSELGLSTAGDRYESSGELRPVTVTDTRSAAPGWTVSGQVSDFATAGDVISGACLGWAPIVLGQPAAGGVAPGPEVAADCSTGLGLSSSLATAATGSGTGTSLLVADLALVAPTTTAPGEYSAVLTLTVI